MITAEPNRKVEAKTKSQIATGADVVVETLEAQGVTHVFGVPGAKIDIGGLRYPPYDHNRILREIVMPS